MTSYGLFLSMLLGCCLGAISSTAQPQSYPLKPIKVIVPVAAGGATDLIVPAATPAEVIGKLNAEINRALKQQDVKDKLAGAGADAVGTSPEELGRFMRAESRKFAQLIKASGAKLD